MASILSGFLRCDLQRQRFAIFLLRIVVVVIRSDGTRQNEGDEDQKQRESQAGAQNSVFSPTFFVTFGNGRLIRPIQGSCRPSVPDVPVRPVSAGSLCGHIVAIARHGPRGVLKTFAKTAIFARLARTTGVVAAGAACHVIRSPVLNAISGEPACGDPLRVKRDIADRTLGLVSRGRRIGRDAGSA